MSDNNCLQSLSKMKRYKSRSIGIPSDTEWCQEWLKLNKLEHLFPAIEASRVDIEKLSECDNITIQETAAYKIGLKGDDLSLFVASVIRYFSLESLYQRNEEVSSCLNTLEFTQKEMEIKRQNDTVYIQEKFKKLIKALQKRQDVLVAEIEEKATAKQQVLDDQMSSLREYQSKLESQHELLLQIKVEDILNEEDSAMDRLDALNMSSKVMLNESIKYDHDRFSRINKMSVEVTNYDDLVAQIKATGYIEDEFDRYPMSHSSVHSVSESLSSGIPRGIPNGVPNGIPIGVHFDIDENSEYNSGHHSVHKSSYHSTHSHVPNDNELQCVCGSPLILTNVEFAYRSDEKVFCQFCKHKCEVPQSGDIYHCPRGDTDAHPGGFDLCSLCGTHSIKLRKEEQRRENEAKQWEKDRESRQYMRSSIDRSNVQSLHRSRVAGGHRSHCRNATTIVNAVASMESSAKRNHMRSQSAVRGSQWNMRFNPDQLMDRDYFQHFPFPTQLKRVVEMGYDAGRAKELVLKHNGSMTEIMNVE